jgi:pimeloyl-ACP methyl ester carboxylesterase
VRTPIEVAVAGGPLAVYRLGAIDPDATQVLAIHGITSSSRTWLASARALEDHAGLLAVDLRGRAASHELPGPFGIDAHVRDMLAVLDHFGLQRAIVAGHSLGAYIAARLAVEYPDRVERLVLVDGGLAIPGSRGTDPEQFMQDFLGPSLQRLGMTFPDGATYRDWWGEHPALGSDEIAAQDLDEYAAHDLVGEAPRLHSSVNPEAVRADGRDLFGAPDADRLNVPAVLLCATRGMIDDPNPMQPLALVQEWAAGDPGQRRAVEVTDTNHFTIVLGARGARAVAGEIARAVRR